MPDTVDGLAADTDQAAAGPCTALQDADHTTAAVDEQTPVPLHCAGLDHSGTGCCSAGRRHSTAGCIHTRHCSTERTHDENTVHHCVH